jgi:hypothetical protein
LVSSDASLEYKADYAHKTCEDGHGDRYDAFVSVLQAYSNAIVQKYKQSIAYNAEFMTGAVNGNEGEACMTFTGI